MPEIRGSVTVRRSFLYRPYTTFRRRLEEGKEIASVQMVESLMPSMTLSGIADYLKYLETDGRRQKLFDFYGHSWFLSKSWDVSKAQQASYDYGIKAILDCRLCDWTRIVRHPERLAIQAQSTGKEVHRSGKSTETQKHLPSTTHNGTGLTHTLCFFSTAFFRSKAKSLDYDVVGCHEFYTSAKCPRNDCRSFLRNGKNRSRYCDRCAAYFDRDIVGSENIAQTNKFKPSTGS
ncbi:hypothetical protein BGZ65_000988 [Modicella reniformis]|uniref:Cas12f1-like TNB domain-containing protein n=1 Tax=Modicella reniformis TaxID=1440133 RepID=A0A9P6SN48_9FUNG|nr:hypothetical protein BGZ65_000988 [Modicella reniformis]